jgi:hypothetical protein
MFKISRKQAIRATIINTVFWYRVAYSLFESDFEWIQRGFHKIMELLSDFVRCILRNRLLLLWSNSETLERIVICNYESYVYSGANPGNGIINNDKNQALHIHISIYTIVCMCIFLQKIDHWVVIAVIQIEIFRTPWVVYTFLDVLPAHFEVVLISGSRSWYLILTS